jgi:hypothetical protein
MRIMVNRVRVVTMTGLVTQVTVGAYLYMYVLYEY